MMYLHPQRNANLRNSTVFLLSIILSVACLRSATAAGLINPPSAPPGGQTAEPITSSSLEQHKLGSLIIGPSGSAGSLNPSLCLNSGSVDGSSRCIKNWWTDIGSSLGLAYIQVHPTDVADGASAQLQLGYAWLRGNNVATYPVTSRFGVWPGASPDFLPYTALYANGLTLDNNAGYFVGTVGIEPTINNTPGRLCLNGTAVPGDGSAAATAGFYCITQWTDINTTVTNKLTLQSLVATPVNEQGNVGLGQAFNSASFVIGDPLSLSTTFTCGDGMCSSKETVGSCPMDCSTIKPLGGITANQVGTTINLNMTTGASQDPVGSLVTVLVVRSTSSSTTFKPMDGVTYARGGTTSFEIVGSRTCAAGVANGCNLIDSPVSSTNDLIAGKTYYYTAYQGNLYPRYQSFTAPSVPPTVSIKVTSPDPNPEDPPDDPPPLLH